MCNEGQAVRRQLEKRENGTPAERDLWTQDQATEGWVHAKIVASRPKSADVKNRPRIAAVEVDPAGCSYNPDYEQHQDAVAVAVAAENMKLIDRELQPKVCVLETWRSLLCFPVPPQSAWANAQGTCCLSCVVCHSPESPDCPLFLVCLMGDDITARCSYHGWQCVAACHDVVRMPATSAPSLVFIWMRG